MVRSSDPLQGHKKRGEIMNRRLSEKGQIIVILALGMVAILAITALAVDGSLLYNQRRNDQNTADSAALAGAGAAAQKLRGFKPSEFSCGPGSTSLAMQASDLAVDAAVLSALDDGVNLDRYNLSNKNGVTVRCETDGDGDQYLDVHVMVSSEKETTFARIISIDTLDTTSEAVARVYPNQPFAGGNALVSLADNCDFRNGGIFAWGGSTTFITGGGIFSNSCVEASGSTEVHIINGTVHAYQTTGCSNYDPNNTENRVPCEKADEMLPKGMIPEPVCPTRTAANTKSEGIYDGTIKPGWYLNGISTKNKGSLTLLPGLYCIKGDLENNAQSTLIAEGVTLFMIDGGVEIRQNDAGQVSLKSCGTPPCVTLGREDFPAVQGLLMIFDYDNDSDVIMNGCSTNEFVGTIYGESNDFTLNGDSTDSTFNTQIVSKSVYVSGSATLDMNLDSTLWVQKPSSLSLIR